MAICTLCEKTFQKKHPHRARCYECSPLKTNGEDDSWDTICIICDKKYKYDRKKGHTKEKCNSCSVNIRRFARKMKALEIKGGKCFICNYSKCSRALQFHHLDETSKDFGIGGNHTRSWELIEKELEKCVLLCANCHMEVHDSLIDLLEIVKLKSNN